MEKVYFKNIKGERLAGISHSCDSDKAVVMIHGLSGDKDELGVFTQVADALQKNSYAVLRFDCAGSGESEGDSKYMTRRSEAEDLSAAIDWVGSRHPKLGIIGLSMGAFVSVIKTYDSVQTIIMYSPAIYGGDFRERYGTNEQFMDELEKEGWFDKKGFYISQGLMDEYDTFDVEKLLSEVGIPVLVIHGSDDDVIPLAEAEKTAKGLGAEMEIIDGSDHNFKKQEYKDELIQLTLDWLNKRLI